MLMDLMGCGGRGEEPYLEERETKSSALYKTKLKGDVLLVGTKAFSTCAVVSGNARPEQQLPLLR